MRKRDCYEWTVRFRVHKSWVADGFNLDDERAKEMLAHDLQFAYGHELDAKVMAAPDPERIAKEQGYKSAAEMPTR
jgi:hypothetical protein